MEKSIAIRKAEFTQSLAQVINTAGLPPCVVADTMALVLAEVQKLANEQLQKDLEAYRKAQEEEAKKTEEPNFIDKARKDFEEIEDHVSYVKESEAKEDGE